MVEMKTEAISEAEAALYDRQIRLWGLDAQKRLRAANVLIAGACGFGAEVIKNLVLAGVKSLCILDHEKVTELDKISNFLISHDSDGTNIAEASLERAQALNPMVNVRTDTGNICEKKEEYFTQFSVVCLFKCSREEIIRINNVCRNHDIIFYAGDVFGFYGFLFSDLGEHTFAEEVKEKSEKEVNGVKEVIEETKMVKRVESYVSFAAALDVDWTSKKYSLRLKRTVSDYFIMQALLEFEFLHKRRPRPESRDQDKIELLSIKNAILDKLQIPQTKVSIEFAENVYGQVGPVCAVLGGILGQEVIKAVSKNNTPINNLFFFNPKYCDGSVECIGN